MQTGGIMALILRILILCFLSAAVFSSPGVAAYLSKGLNRAEALYEEAAAKFDVAALQRAGALTLAVKDANPYETQLLYGKINTMLAQLYWFNQQKTDAAKAAETALFALNQSYSDAGTNDKNDIRFYRSYASVIAGKVGGTTPVNNAMSSDDLDYLVKAEPNAERTRYLVALNDIHGSTRKRREACTHFKTLHDEFSDNMAYRIYSLYCRRVEGDKEAAAELGEILMKQPYNALARWARGHKP
jgi:hypothetical protein